MYSYIDMHCDSLLRVLDRGEENLYNGAGMQSIQKMAEAGQMCQFFAIFLRPEWEQQEAEAYIKMLGKALYSQVSLHGEQIAMAHNYEEIQANRRAGKVSAVLTLEDGRVLNGKVEKLCELYEAGIRGITLSWNQPNCLGYPNTTMVERMRRGLTEFGKETVRQMQQIGMLVDVSHLSDGGFWEVCELCRKPFIASHSNARALCPHPRNLSDEMIQRMAECGGVAGINLYPVFGGKEVEVLVEHILHFIKVGGEESVGIGTDFDGMEGEPVIDSPVKMEYLFDMLHRKGLKHTQIEKIAFGNVLRVIKEAMK